MVHDLMDQVVRANVATDANNKRKWEDDQGIIFGQKQNKQAKVVRAYAVGSSDRRGYARTLPLCDECKLHHHHGPCPPQCGSCKKVGHKTRHCWNPTSMTCY
ncbi:hypothetical protein Tco_1120004 [Tanacetum coccineum]